MVKDFGRYKYAVLRYRHSAFLGESLNIGYIVYFEKEQKIFFNQTNNIQRISSLYPDFSYKLVKNYINDVKKIIDDINNESTLFDYGIDDNLNLFLNDNVIPFDGSSLVFSKETSCYRHELLINNVLSYLSDLYVFNKKAPVKKKTVKDIFYNSVKEFVREEKYSVDPNFFKDYKIENEIGTEFNFDFAWQNGNLNLIKTLDLNFSTANAISKKSYENFGLLYDLKETAYNENYNFDFLVSEPTEHSLHKEYDHSIKLISDLPYANVIEEKEFSFYVKKVKEHIS